MSEFGGGSGKRGHRSRAGWLRVSVGPEGRRFVIRTEYANHPVFQELLDFEHRFWGGFEYRASPGPLALPSCTVNGFYNALFRIEHLSESKAGLHRKGHARRRPSRHHLMVSPFNVFAVHQFY